MIFEFVFFRLLVDERTGSAFAAGGLAVMAASMLMRYATAASRFAKVKKVSGTNCRTGARKLGRGERSPDVICETIGVFSPSEQMPFFSQCAIFT